jgi:transcriptional regulator with XRE-family HTH domain
MNDMTEFQPAPDLQYVLSKLEEHRGKWAQVAEDTEISRHYLSKLHRRVWKNPGINTINRLAEYFRLREAQGRHVKAAMRRQAT